MRATLVALSVFAFGQLTFAALDIPEHLRAPLKLIRKACIDESHVDEKYIDASKNGYLPDVPELKCYILCLFELGGVIDTDNSIDFDKVMHLLPASIRETLDHVVKTCGTISAPTRCEIAWQTVKCFFELAPEGAELP